MRLGQPISAEEINRAVQSGTSYSVLSRQYNIPINKVCEYTENKSGTYRVYILCQVAKSATIPVQFDGFSSCYEGANRFYAAEALAADGVDVYKTSRRLSEQSVRSLFANSRAYSAYESGMSIYHSNFWRKDYGLSTSEGISYLILAAGGTMAVCGYGFSPLMTDEEGDSEALAASGAAAYGRPSGAALRGHSKGGLKEQGKPCLAWMLCGLHVLPVRAGGPPERYLYRRKLAADAVHRSLGARRIRFLQGLGR